MSTRLFRLQKPLTALLINNSHIEYNQKNALPVPLSINICTYYETRQTNTGLRLGHLSGFPEKEGGRYPRGFPSNIER